MMNDNRILVVDDDRRITGFIEMVLKAQGYVVKTTNDSVMAASVAQSFDPNLVLLDVSMPFKDGGDVAQELRSLHITAHVPITRTHSS